MKKVFATRALITVATLLWTDIAFGVPSINRTAIETLVVTGCDCASYFDNGKAEKETKGFSHTYKRGSMAFFIEAAS